MAKSWCVHAEPPTANMKVIQEYLGSYICRIGLSKNRFHYDSVHKRVTLTFKDYRNKKDTDSTVPMNYKQLPPIVAIDQIMAHCLPPYFQKFRYYGLHASATYRKVSTNLPICIKNNSQTVRTVFPIITAMLGLEDLACDNCNSKVFHKSIIAADRSWKYNWLPMPHSRGSPPKYAHITQKMTTATASQVSSMPKPQ